MEVNNLLTQETAQGSTVALPNGLGQLQQQQQQQQQQHHHHHHHQHHQHHHQQQQQHQSQHQHQQQRCHQYPTRHSTITSAYPHGTGDGQSTPPPNSAGTHVATPNSYNASPQNSANPKNVAFELLFPDSPNYRARLPMRVQIFPHDTTDSIVTTVKNFYGLYEGPGGAKGISFEDEDGHTLIASHENFKNNMVIYVRVLVEPPVAQGYHDPPAHTPGSPTHNAQHPPGCYPGESRQMLPPQPAQALTYGQPPSRPHSRMARDRSTSPQPGRGRRSISANTNHDPSKSSRLRPGMKSRGSSAHGSGADRTADAINGFSDSDGGHGSSVTSSKKAKSEQLASAEISLDNIVEGGRRKRAKFESSELPLFVPPQVPMAASSSSVSPARRTLHQLGPTPFAQSGQRTFAYPYPYPVPSPQHAGQSATGYAFGPPSGSSLSTPSGPPHGHHLRNRVSGAYPTPRGSSGATPTGHHLGGILPTPDPTIASCISDEDVALQLMRLGDTSNISHGRHSASTLDDGLSGVADAASSTGATSDGESDGESDGTEQPGLPPAGPARAPLESSPIPLPGSIKRRHQHLDEILPSFDSTEPSGDESGRVVTDRRDHADDRRDGTYAIKGETRRSDTFMDELEMAIRPGFPAPRPGPLATPKPRSHHAKAKSANKATPSRIAVALKGKAKRAALPSGAVPISPASLPSQSRKTSGASVATFQHALGEDEEDLSSKPRCQRCRKSKKGCDRQRPCQRCRDAGIGIEGCVSEDEGNGRKGRFGRHMGVVVKKGANEGSLAGASASGSPSGSVVASGGGMPEKSKKRKR